MCFSCFGNSLKQIILYKLDSKAAPGTTLGDQHNNLEHRDRTLASGLNLAGRLIYFGPTKLDIIMLNLAHQYY